MANTYKHGDSISWQTLVLVIRRCQNLLPRSCKETLFETVIRSILDNGNTIYDSCLKMGSESPLKFQRKAALVCTGAFRVASNEKLLNGLGCSIMENRRKFHRLTLFYRISNSHTPSFVQQTCNLIPKTPMLVSDVEITLISFLLLGEKYS